MRELERKERKRGGQRVRESERGRERFEGGGVENQLGSWGEGVGEVTQRG